MAKKKKKEEEYKFRLNIDTSEKPHIHAGWICPNCKTIYSPYVKECSKCVIETFTWVHEKGK